MTAAAVLIVGFAATWLTMPTNSSGFSRGGEVVLGHISAPASWFAIGLTRQEPLGACIRWSAPYKHHPNAAVPYRDCLEAAPRTVVDPGDLRRRVLVIFGAGAALLGVGLIALRPRRPADL